MLRNRPILIPKLVRIQQGALDKLGIYTKTLKFKNAVLIYGRELDRLLVDRVAVSLENNAINVLQHVEVDTSSFEQAQEVFGLLPQGIEVIIGLGGGKALDVAKYVAFLGQMPYLAVPTSLSNDGFCSPQSSLEFHGKRRSFPAMMPYGVVVDVEVCFNAPRVLWWSGIGDLSAKITAVYDWELAMEQEGTRVDDFAALLSDATVFQLIAKPEHDLEGISLLATALMLNGVSMEICGSSRPASGSEHLISHALDTITERPRLHGLQVGIAAYIVSHLQKQGTERIVKLFDATGFWKGVLEDPFSKEEWLEAFHMAPSVKANFYTILNTRECFNEFKEIIETDHRLKGVFV